jgi:hypothetical protein
LTSPKKLDAFRAAARRRAVEKFDIELIVPLYEQVYERTLRR